MMRPRQALPHRGQASMAALCAAVLLGLSACSDDDSAPPAPTVTATAVPTSTSTALPSATRTAPPTATQTAPPTATHTPEATPTPTTADVHAELIFGSNQPGGGALATELESDHAHLAFDTCLGGAGDDCEGGIEVFSGDSPGYERLDEDMPDESLYVLADGTTVSVEIVAIDEGLSLRKEGATADAPGESLVLGTVPELDHTHVEYVATIPGGTVGWEKNVTLRLTTTSAAYTASEPRTLTFAEEHD